MKMGGTDTHTSRGFTIIEVIIVLAVTATLFVSATVYISGRQAKTEFQVGSQQLQQQFQQIISDVQNGYYPNSGSIYCSVSAGVVVLSSAGTAGQGGNKDCIFVGKVIVLGGQTPAQYKVFSLAGKRQSAPGKEVANVDEAQPVALAPATASDTFSDLTATATVPSGLTFQWVSNDKGVTKTTAAASYTGVAFMSDFSTFATATSTAGSSQTFSLRGLGSGGWTAPWGANATAQGQATLINKEATAANTNQHFPTQTSLQYCFASGGTNQSVLITISSGLQVTSEIKSGTQC